jgi:nitroimidazol reductase NimA-like FMN-containing flavoprotein (pyridoxamine 5'-phosphate oxidase superfamily)
MAEDRSFFEKVAMTNPELVNYLSQPLIARIASVKASRPYVTPVWYLYDGKDFLVSTGVNTQQAKNIQSNPNVSLVIDSSAGMFAHKCVIVRGKAEVTRAGHPEITKKIYARYLGETGLKIQFAKQLLEEAQYIVRVKPSKIITWDYTKLIK